MITSSLFGPTWLRADYHVPSLYSCRMPMSSATSAAAIPAPCPSTIRLALLRTSIEIFGEDETRDIVFPIVRSMRVAIRPPERVACTLQHLRAYKASAGHAEQDDRFDETIAYREFAHATGSISVYIEVPDTDRLMFEILLSAIGYWGQASSLVQCTAIELCEPNYAECLTSLRSLSDTLRLQAFVISLGTEFRSDKLEWSEVVPFGRGQHNEFLTIEFYIWPMVVIEQHRGDRLLLRRSI